jgi:hypothetical protein
MLHHVTLEEANSAAIYPISHPNRSDRRLLPPLNHDLHLQKPDHHVWLQHLAAVSGVLFARAALVARLSANDFDNNAGGMKYHGVMYFCYLLVFFVTLAVRIRRSNGKVGQIGDRWKGPFKAESFSSFN